MSGTPPKPLQPGSRPTPPGIPNPSCWVLLEARDVLGRARDLRAAIRHLRQSTQRCSTCPEKTECPSLRHFAQALDTAVREVRQEWGLEEEVS